MSLFLLAKQARKYRENNKKCNLPDRGTTYKLIDLLHG